QMVVIPGSMTEHVSGTYIFQQNLKPAVTITSPRASQHLTNSVLVAGGTAASSPGILEVFCQLNAGDWLPAVSTNGFTNWTASASPVPGSNLFSAFALDNNGNSSTTSSVVFFYDQVLSLTVLTSGNGSLTPQYNGTLLVLGKNYTI